MWRKDFKKQAQKIAISVREIATHGRIFATALMKKIYTEIRYSVIYADTAAFTPCDATIAYEMYTKSVDVGHGNPRGLHRRSRASHEILEDARTVVARTLRVQASEITFTRGGSDSIRQAFEGVFDSYFSTPSTSSGSGAQGKPHVITTCIEHQAVLQPLRAFREKGIIDLTELPVNEFGLVNTQALVESLRSETILVTIHAIHNEIGVIQPITKIAKIIESWRTDQKTEYPIFHTDAVQAGWYGEVLPHTLRADLISFSSAKMYGPAGSGILYHRKGIMWSDTEALSRTYHEGTPDSISSYGCSLALTSARERYHDEKKRMMNLRNELIYTLYSTCGDWVRVHGDIDSSAPHIIAISMKNISGERLALELDARRICASAKAACQTDEMGEPLILGHLYGKDSPYTKWGFARFSFGPMTTLRDIHRIVGAITEIHEKIEKEVQMYKQN